MHGPGFPLAVVRCSVHGRAFTLYPPAWVPYAWLAVAPARLDGERGEGLNDTLVEFGLETASGAAWLWNLGGDPAAPRLGYTTEYNRIARCSRMVGVHADQSIEQRHDIGEILGVPALDLMDLASGHVRPLYLAQAQAVQAVVKRLSVPLDWQAMLVAGHIAGLWGRPLWCRGGHLVPLAFRAAGTPVSRSPGRSAASPTNSVREGSRAPP